MQKLSANKADVLPDVFPELPQGTFDGSTLIVKNTFIDLRRSSTEGPDMTSRNRSKSVPLLLSELSCTFSTTSPKFVDVRRRILTFGCSDYDADAKKSESPRSCTASTCTPTSPSSSSMPTTVLLKNIPEEYTREMLIDTLNSQGFLGLFNFVYAPINLGKLTSFGYAFVNFVSAEDADDFFNTFEHFRSWSVASPRVAEVEWSDRQGLDSLVERYRNSPLMHASAPDKAKPVMLQDGVRVDFPAPTQVVKPLRFRQSKMRKA